MTETNNSGKGHVLEKDIAFTYQAYGLTIRSSLSLTSLRECTVGKADVRVREGQIDHPLPKNPDDPTSWGCYHTTPTTAVLYYKGVGQIEVRDGQQITIDQEPDAEYPMTQHILLGVSLGILLHQRGYLTLHASGVSIDGKVAAFIGWKRMGKSTTATALYAAGHRLITDDVIVTSPDDLTTVLPGFSQIRLDPEAVAASLNVDPDSVPRLHSTGEKRTSQADKDFDLTPVPLFSIYVLDWGDDFEIERLPQDEAFVQLLTHSYAQRFLGNTGATQTHFDQITHLARTVPVYRFTKPRDFDRLPELVQFIENHMDEIGSSQGY